MRMASIFTDTVYKITRQIPSGKVVTYGQLAKMAGRPGAARAVGMCMRNNPNIPSTPCHRVVGSNGALVGYAGGSGLPSKKDLLLKEGVVFRGDKVDLKQSQWLPEKI